MHHVMKVELNLYASTSVACYQLAWSILVVTTFV